METVIQDGSDAMKEEIDFLQKFNTFKDMGKIPFLADHKKIIVHFVFAVNTTYVIKLDLLLVVI
jgi:hypothetical protein